MKTHYKAFHEIRQLSHFDKTFAADFEKLAAFIRYSPSVKSIIEAQKARVHFEGREVLCEEILRQYGELTNVDSSTTERIKSLRTSDTFTVITAHQPSLLTGPLYFVLKALSAIKAAQMVNDQTDDFSVLPIFVIGGEDHDFEETNHFTFHGKTYTWIDHQGGPTGRYDTDSLVELLDEFEDELGISATSFDLKEKLIKPFLHHKNYGTAMQQAVHNLLGHYGILVVQMDSKAFKERFRDIMIDDIAEHSSHDLVNSTQDKLSALGFKNQAYARPINLFYLSPGRRERIERVEKDYHLVESGIKYSSQELHQQINDHPERFSPNVILRPLYQEIIFPNLAYIGGGGELAYWTERLSQFDHYDIPFPVLIRRDSMVWIDSIVDRRIQKLNLEPDFLWNTPHRQADQYLSAHGDYDLNLAEQKEEIIKKMKDIESLAIHVDPTLGPYIAAETRKLEKNLEHYSTKLKRAEKRKNGFIVNHLEKIHESLFPNDGLQERKINFAEFYLTMGTELFDILLDHADPFDIRFKMLWEPRR